VRKDHAAVWAEKPRVGGKFIFLGDEKLYLRGVTYGTFGRREDGTEYPSADAVDRDFASMSASGVNAVRTYTVPPLWLLDLADDHGLHIMVGIPWEQHVAFLDDRRRARSIERRVRDGLTEIGGALPVNPSGGLKAKGHPIGATGVSMHVMTAMQLLGQAPEGMQIKDAKLAGIFNMGGAAVANYVSLLEPTR